MEAYHTGNLDAWRKKISQKNSFEASATATEILHKKLQMEAEHRLEDLANIKEQELELRQQYYEHKNRLDFSEKYFGGIDIRLVQELVRKEYPEKFI